MSDYINVVGSTEANFASIHNLDPAYKIQNLCTHRGEFFSRNFIKSNRNQIVFTIFRLIRIQTDVRLDPNQSKNGKYNLISG